MGKPVGLQGLETGKIYQVRMRGREVSGVFTAKLMEIVPYARWGKITPGGHFRKLIFDNGVTLHTAWESDFFEVRE